MLLVACQRRSRSWPSSPASGQPPWSLLALHHSPSSSHVHGCKHESKNDTTEGVAKTCVATRGCKWRSQTDLM